jgi:hypothetical protein
MANAVRGEVEIEVEGETRTLVLDFNGLCEVEGASGGRKTEDLIEELKAGPSFSTIRAFMLGALKRHEPKATLMDAGDVVQALGASDARLKVIEAIAAAFPVAEAGKATANPPQKRAAGTTRNSSSAG